MGMASSFIEYYLVQTNSLVPYYCYYYYYFLQLYLFNLLFIYFTSPTTITKIIWEEWFRNWLVPLSVFYVCSHDFQIGVSDGLEDCIQSFFYFHQLQRWTFSSTRQREREREQGSIALFFFNHQRFSSNTSYLLTGKTKITQLWEEKVCYCFVEKNVCSKLETWSFTP